MASTPLGRHPSLSWADYRATGALGSTAIRTAAAKSVAHHLEQQKREASRAMRRGSVDHLVLLTPEELAQRYVVAPAQQCVARTKAKGEPQCSKTALSGAEHCTQHGGEAEHDAYHARAAAEGREVVTSDELRASQERVEAVRAHVRASETPRLLDAGDREVSYLARAILDGDGYEIRVTGDEGILVCARIDLQHGRLLVDAKGCRDVTDDAWARQLQEYGLHIQAALYSDIVRAVDGHEPTWGWLAYEAEAPYAVRIFDAHPIDLSAGRLEVARGLQRWAHYRATGDAWAGWERKRRTVARPRWAWAREEEAAEMAAKEAA